MFTGEGHSDAESRRKFKVFRWLWEFCFCHCASLSGDLTEILNIALPHRIDSEQSMFEAIFIELKRLFFLVDALRIHVDMDTRG